MKVVGIGIHGHGKIYGRMNIEEDDFYDKEITFTYDDKIIDVKILCDVQIRSRAIPFLAIFPDLDSVHAYILARPHTWFNIPNPEKLEMRERNNKFLSDKIEAGKIKEANSKAVSEEFRMQRERKEKARAIMQEAQEKKARKAAELKAINDRAAAELKAEKEKLKAEKQREKEEEEARIMAQTENFAAKHDNATSMNSGW